MFEACLMVLFNVGRDPVEEASELDGRRVKSVKVPVEIT